MSGFLVEILLALIEAPVLIFVKYGYERVANNLLKQKTWILYNIGEQFQECFANSGNLVCMSVPRRSCESTKVTGPFPQNTNIRKK